jgi:hypothetical protein
VAGEGNEEKHTLTFAHIALIETNLTAIPNIKGHGKSSLPSALKERRTRNISELQSFLPHLYLTSTWKSNVGEK